MARLRTGDGTGAVGGNGENAISYDAWRAYAITIITRVLQFGFYDRDVGRIVVDRAHGDARPAPITRLETTSDNFKAALR